MLSITSKHIKVLLRAIIFTTLLVTFNIIYLSPTLTIFLKGRTSVRPKPGLGIGNQNQGPILVSVLEPFFFDTETFVFNFFQASKFTHFFPLLGRIQVLISLKIDPDLQKYFKRKEIWL